MMLVKFQYEGKPLYINPEQVASVSSFGDNACEIELVTGNKYRIQDNVNIVVAALEE